MLPPKPTPKRDIGVNIRFNTIEYSRLRQIADYRELTVSALLHHVITNGILARLEGEIKRELAASHGSPVIEVPEPIDGTSHINNPRSETDLE